MAGRVRDVPSRLREDLSFTGSFDCHISITFQAHTLVSPQGVCARAIFAAAGPNIAKIYQAPTLGEITVTPGYLLACSHVIHTCCSKWDGGNGEVVCAFFYAMLVLYSNNNSVKVLIVTTPVTFGFGGLTFSIGTLKH